MKDGIDFYLTSIFFDTYLHTCKGVSKWAGTRYLRSCIVQAEITEPPKISGGQNHKYDRLV